MNRWKLLEEKVRMLADKVRDLARENQKIKNHNAELQERISLSEEENKKAKKHLKDREIIKNKVMTLVENMEKMGVR